MYILAYHARLQLSRILPALDHELINCSWTARGRGETMPIIDGSESLCDRLDGNVLMNTNTTYLHQCKRPKYLCACINWPVGWWSLQMVCVPSSISHTSELQSSTHHWKWSTSCTGEPWEHNFTCITVINATATHEKLTWTQVQSKHEKYLHWYCFLWLHSNQLTVFIHYLQRKQSCRNGENRTISISLSGVQN